MSIFEELRRRNVVRVGAAYAVAAWILLQVLDVVGEILELPQWGGKLILVLLVVGFFLAVILAWAYELTPEGIKRESEIADDASITRATGKKLNFVIIGLLLVVILMLIGERVFFSGGFGSGPDSAAAEPPKSIAVLPFADLSQAQDQGWFADGLAEEILNALVKVPDLQVAARTSSFAYKGQNKAISEIANELGVAHVLEGSVRSAGERIRVTAQLIRAADGFHLWSQNYDRDVADMIGIQEDLARSIATALETSMDPAALAEMAQVGTDSVEAYQAYLRGLQLRAEAETYSIGPRLTMTREAYEQFERARALDPDFAEAHVQAAEFWKTELTPNAMESGLTDLSAREQLTEYNQRIALAIERADSEADRLRSLADRAMVDLRLREALQLFQQYVALRPNDEQALDNLMIVALMLSDQAATRSAAEQLKERAAVGVNGAILFAEQAWRGGLAAEVAPTLLEAVRRWPNSSQLLYQSHRSLLWAGRRQEAAELAARFGALVPESHPVLRARVACADGDRAAAERILAGLDPDSTNYLIQRWLILNLLGQHSEAEALLQPLAASGVPYPLSTFLIYPQFDPRLFPELMAVLQREGVQRPPPLEPPFSCPPPTQPSVAVLPFVNMSADAEQEYFSDGMTEEIINALVRVPGLKVAARTSVFAFKGRGQDVRAIGDELDVTHVVEGSVRSDGQQLRITAQLIQVADGFHLWSETFDRPRANVFAIQEEIAGAIAGVLTEQLGEQGGGAPAAPEVARIGGQAYDDYLRGRALLRSRGPENVEQAIGLFQAVTAAHPDYAPGWASLAIAADVTDDHELAERSARRALELEPDNVDALTALGSAYRDTLRWAEAEALFRQALALDPDSAELAEDYGELLARTGQLARALEVTAHGYAIDPYLVPLAQVHAAALVGTGQPEQAIEILEQSIARGGPAAWPRVEMAMTLWGLGDLAGVREIVAVLPVPAAEERLKGLLVAALDDPDNEETLAALQAELSGPVLAYASAYMLLESALLHLGRLDALMEHYLREAAQGRDLQNDALFLPAYAPLRAHPRFAEWLDAVGLPDYWDQAGWPEYCRREAEQIRCG